MQSRGDGAEGVTLIELLIALVISSVLITGVYSVYITQTRTYTAQDRVVELQQDARAAFAVMTKDIRMAGFLTGPGSSSGFVVEPPESPPITINGYIYAVTPTNQTHDSDSITVVYADPLLGELSLAPSSNTLTLDRGVPCNVAAGDFIAFDLHPGVSEGTLYRVSQSASKDDTSMTVTAPPGDLSERERVYAIRTVSYTVSGGVLRRNIYNGAGAQPLAGDGASTIVEDLQFVYHMESGTRQHAPTNPAEIEAVEINLVMRSGVPEPVGSAFSKPACGDRGQEDTFQGCRRRMYTTTVKIRNL